MSSISPYPDSVLGSTVKFYTRTYLNLAQFSFGCRATLKEFIYRAFFSAHRTLTIFLFFLYQFVSGIGERMSAAALELRSFEAAGSSAVAFVQTLPLIVIVLGSPFLGSIAGRLRLRPSMVMLNILLGFFPLGLYVAYRQDASTLVFGLILAAATAPQVLLANLQTRTFQGLVRGFSVQDRDKLGSGQSASQNLYKGAGGWLGSALYGQVQGGVFLVDMATYWVAAAMVPLFARPEAPRVVPRLSRKRRLVALRRVRRNIPAVIAGLATFIFAGVIDVLGPAIVSGDPTALANYKGAFFLGELVGSLTWAAVYTPGTRSLPWALAALAATTGLMPVAAQWSLLEGVRAVQGSLVSLAGILAFNRIVVGQRSKLVGFVGGSYTAVGVLVQIIAANAAGRISDAFGPAVGLYATAITIAVLMVFSFIGVRRTR